MSKVSMTTGNIQFNSQSYEEEYKRSTSEPMHIAVVANFGGDKPRSDLGQRQVIEIDRDNFEEVFEKFSPSLDLPVFEQPIVFREFDDLHPDYLVARVGVFEELQTLKRRLAKPALFEQTVSDIQRLLDIDAHKDLTEQKITEKTLTIDADEASDFMQTLLANSQKNEDASLNPLDDVDAFFRSIVSPYVEPLADPRLDDMLQAVDSATSNLLRKIMHASQFQALESAWRSLYFLVRSVETSSKLKIFIVDVNNDELQKDITEGGVASQSQMYKLLVEDRQVSGGIPFSVINVDAYVSDNLESVRIAESFATIAKASAGIALLGATSRLAGSLSFGDSGDSDDWTLEPEREFSVAWQEFRESSASQHLAIVAPRFMARLPYGASTSPIDSFKYEELGAEHDHGYYLWGNGSFLVNLLLAQSYTHRGWDFSSSVVTNTVEGLPLHIYRRDGESFVKPCAELILTDRSVGRLSSQGMLCVRSISNSDSILIPDFRSVSASGESIFACLSAT